MMITSTTGGKQMGVRVSLKALRVNENLTQAEAAEKIGVSLDKWASWEMKKSFPDVRDVYNIERAFNVQYQDIIFL
ncbi:helix-turn-helix transcriptional regulator [Weissella cibaria]|uniref:helix-turn-helix transcriptional regulator n=2 Tax=Weissella TaxID=46255 RepID=UPI001F54913F|nr:MULTISPECIES: helix-turn-helix transcriptional regulator [Weissella]WCE24284.1 helix-turn-helix transcriptional regulator [Weissella cibaria]WCE26472.1 helix-turn-helix transcriptional regulator [Weissella cibaria]